MNIFRLIVALVFLAIGLLVGVLNTQPITLKLLFTQINTSSGVAIILSLIVGVIIGVLIALATLVWPLYTKLRKANKQAAVTSSASNPGAGL